MIDTTFHALCKEILGETPHQVEKLPQSGSDRQYFRLFLSNKTVMGVYNPNVPENVAFINLANAFLKQNLPVPEIFGMDTSQMFYLCSDHGNDTLFHRLKKEEDGNLHTTTYKYFEQSIKHLAGFQLAYIKEPNLFNFCNPPREFNHRSVMWDLNYFKYNFLKLNAIAFDESALEDDFEKLAVKVSTIPLQGFMYRDFQSRNIMIDNEKTVFIDFQGGRRGPLQYDVVSMLWQARANLSTQDREKLINAYLNELKNTIPNCEETFRKDFDIVLLLRLLQVLGAYGFRGMFERKVHFIKSIPFAINQLKEHWSDATFEIEYPELHKCVLQLDKVLKQSQPAISGLTINICSFSFLNGSYPVDLTGHGGGYVFDCRGLPNPGRLDGYKHLTGKDKKVADYLKLYDEVENYIESVYKIIEKHANTYENKGFNTLNISFGCTGGQHRSVYCAEEINKRLTYNGFNTKLWHREFPTI
jgi:aminoglycoside/choline kinase family phosphotransferase